jgi:hypothetical protein
VNPALLADLLAALHLAVVLFVILGQAAILVGGILHWRWVRDMRFRLLHLAVIVFVAVQGMFDRICPLTIWENELRERAGQEGLEGTFVGRLARDILFVDVPQRTLNRYYVAFALIVLASFWMVKPRRRAAA